MAALLEMKGMTKAYSGHVVLNDVSMTLNSGECICLCGENGAGKSTFIKLLSGSIPATSGEIYINGQKVDFKNPIDAIDAGVGVIYQELNYLNDLTIAENIFCGNLPMKKNGLVDWKKMNEDVKPILESVGLSRKPTEKVRSLTIAEKQLLEIAKIISKNQKIVVFDEPTAVLNEEEIKKIYKIIFQLKEAGLGIIYISHHLDECFIVGDKIKVLRDGNDIGTRNTKDTNVDELVTLMVGREIKDLYQKGVYTDITQTALQVDDVSAPGIQDISFKVHKGEVVSFFGLMGCGNTQIMEALFGFTRKTKGTIRIYGEEVEFNQPRDAVEKGIAYVPAERKTQGLIVKQSIRENVVACSISEFTKGILMDNAKEKSETDSLIEKFRVVCSGRNHLINGLSGGNQQKVLIGKWLRKKPSIVMFNEPTRGVDVGAKADIYKVIDDLCKEGVAVVLITSELPELLALSDRCYSVKNGQIVKEFKKEEINQEALLRSVV